MDLENISIGDEKRIKEIIEEYNKKIIRPRNRKIIIKITNHFTILIYSIFLIMSFYYVEHFYYLQSIIENDRELFSFILMPFVLGIGVFLMYIAVVYNERVK
jgi:hypothetical protein